MSDFASILEKTRRTLARASKLEAAAMAAPDDRALQNDLRAIRRLAARYQEQLYEAAADAQVEVCEYKILKNGSRDYKIAPVSRSLLRFQEILTGIFDAKKSGPKRRARFSTGVKAKTSLSLAYSFPGSLGFALTVPNARDLFDGEFDTVISVFQDVLNIDDPDDVRDIARSLGPTLVRLRLVISGWGLIVLFRG